MERFVVLVCGGRDFDDAELVDWSLTHLKRQPTAIVHGGATGADTLARRWAKFNGVPAYGYSVTPEEWRRLGKKAGPSRNQRMLDEAKPDLVLALPGGRGTADMVRRARAAGVPVIEVPAS